jgi:hypothetical protein
MVKQIPSSMRVFLLAFLGLNLLQSGSTPLLYDEAYFWYYAQNPTWGYFEYPPMIAWMIALGQSFFGGELGIRLITTLCGGGTALFLWLSQARSQDKDPLLFALLFCALPLLHLYTFISLPNSALLFFTALALYRYKCYLERADRINTVLLGLSLAGLLYSEYLGIFILLVFSFAQKGLLKTKTYWLALAVCFVLYIPHLIWLGLHDWVSLRYTFFERPLPEREPLAFTSGTLLNLALVLGALTPFTYKGLLHWRKNEITDRVAFLLSVILLVFYFLSSFQRPIGLHMLALFSLPALLLSISFLSDRSKWRKWAWPLAGGQLVLLLYFRLGLIFPAVSLFPHQAHQVDRWVTILEERSDSLPVVFENNPQKAALYSFYTGKPTYSFNTFRFRKNQYNLDLETEALFRGQRVAYLREQDPMALSYATKDSTYAKLNIQDPFYTYRNLEAWLDTDRIESHNIGARTLLVYNPYIDSIPIGQLKIRVSFRDANRRILESFPAPYLALPKESSKRGPIDQAYIRSQDTTVFRITLPLDAPSEARYLQISLSEYGQLPGLNGRPIRLRLDEKEEENTAD